MALSDEGNEGKAFQHLIHLDTGDVVHRPQQGVSAMEPSFMN